MPVGVGILIAGGNGNEIRGNRIWDNWRRGTMLINVPDAFSGSSGVNSVSHRNRYHDNVMGIAPDGSKVPNGVDFWWDEAPAQEDNCWFQQRHGHDGPAGPADAVELRQHERGRDLSGKFSGELGPCAGVDRGSGELRRDHLLVVPHAREAVAGRWRRDGAAGAGLRSAEGGAAGARLPPRGLDAVVQRAARPALVAAAAILLAGCGGEPAEPQPFGVKLQTATCTDWRESSPQQRQSAVDQLERTVAGPRKEGNTLPDERGVHDARRSM